MKLFQIKPGAKIYEEVITNDESQPGSYLIFKRLDGAYSICSAYDKEGDNLMNGHDVAIVHLSASTPLVEYKDGYKIEREK